MKTPVSNRPRRTPALSCSGFSLIELLVVIVIIAVLIALLAPAATQIQRGMNVTRAGELLQGKINLARQTAVARNRYVEVRFIAEPQAGSGDVYRLFQTFVYDEKGSNPVAFDKHHLLPTGMALATVTGYSRLLESPSHTGTQKIPSLGTGDYDYKAFRFRGNGSTDLDPIGPGGTNADTWSLTLSGENDPPTGSAPPKNFYTIQVDPLSGATVNFRP